MREDPFLSNHPCPEPQFPHQSGQHHGAASPCEPPSLATRHGHEVDPQALPRRSSGDQELLAERPQSGQLGLVKPDHRFYDPGSAVKQFLHETVTEVYKSPATTGLDGQHSRAYQDFSRNDRLGAWLDGQLGVAPEHLPPNSTLARECARRHLGIETDAPMHLKSNVFAMPTIQQDGAPGAFSMFQGLQVWQRRLISAALACRVGPTHIQDLHHSLVDPSCCLGLNPSLEPPVPNRSMRSARNDVLVRQQAPRHPDKAPRHLDKAPRHLDKAPPPNRLIRCNGI